MTMTPQQYNAQLPAPGAYAAGWMGLKAARSTAIVSVPGFIVGMHGWNRQTVPAGIALGHVRRAMNDRINARAGIEPAEPREGFWPLYRDSRAIRACLTTRLRVYSLETRQARRRFSHILAQHDD